MPRRVSDYSQLMEYNTIPMIFTKSQNPSNPQAYIFDTRNYNESMRIVRETDSVLNQVKAMVGESLDLIPYTKEINQCRDMYHC